MKNYQATYTYHEIIPPDDSQIPPRLKYFLRKGKSKLIYDFKEKDDSEAIKNAKKYADEFYKTQKKYVSAELANKPSLEKLVEIIPPRKIKIS